MKRPVFKRLAFRRASILSSLGLAALVSACAQPSPGPSQAASVQAPPTAPQTTLPAAPPTAPQSAPLASKPSTGPEAKAAANDKIQIVFPEGGSRLSPEANKQLDVAARLFRDANPVLMFTTGYSDNSGDEYANLLLSARRAQVVKKALVARGIPADRLLLQALGTSDPANSSDPQAAANRRVVVTWRLI